jgi:DHA1 family bicyclomycin/chloramphenicol resistance-like MFS transporter
MNPDARTIWQAPSWALAILLACLGMLGPFSIDTYLPAFTGIAKAIGASPVEMQQTLSAYLFGFAIMNLFHGALSDSFGRRPVVLGRLAVFTLASVGCALSQHIGALVFFRALQGMSAGAGIVVSRAVIRDMFPPADAQRVMSQVTIYFGVAPAVAPMIGGFLFVHAGWHSIFWLLTGRRRRPVRAQLEAAAGDAARVAQAAVQRGNLFRGYWSLASNPRFLMLALASGIPFNGMFLYVLSTPVFLGEILGLGPASSSGSSSSPSPASWPARSSPGRMAGRVKATRQIRYGFIVMAASARSTSRSTCCSSRARGGRSCRSRSTLRLGDDGAGRDLDGPRPRPRAARHGVVAAGLRRQHGERPGRRPGRARSSCIRPSPWRRRRSR